MYGRGVGQAAKSHWPQFPERFLKRQLYVFPEVLKELTNKIASAWCF